VFDAGCRERFLSAWEEGLEGRYDGWMNTAAGTLALCILFDQLPRNMFRDTPRAFASDPRAGEVARHAVARGFDLERPAVQRTFFYLPFEHSESIADQKESLRLFGLAGSDDKSGLLNYAQRHHDIVARFGRFPHRNAVLGRTSTPEEEAFLSGPDSSF